MNYKKNNSSNNALIMNFVAGLVSLAGSFMWIKQNNRELPVFQIKMPGREKLLLKIIRNTLRIKEKIYEYKKEPRHYALILVRRRSTLEKVIIPSFEHSLRGPKKAQFKKWRSKFFKIKPKLITNH